MSIQFHVQSIYVTTGPATSVDHQGNPYTNTEVPVGTALAVDAEGNWYVHTAYTAGLDLTKENWPRKGKDGIQLYRDYWKFLTATKGKTFNHSKAPYFSAVLNASRKLVRG